MEKEEEEEEEEEEDGVRRRRRTPLGLTGPVKEVSKRPRFSWLKRSRTVAEEVSPACEGE